MRAEENVAARLLPGDAHTGVSLFLRYVQQRCGLGDARHAQAQARVVVVDDGQLARGVDVVLVARHPVQRVLVPQGEPVLQTLLVLQARLAVQELLDGVTIERQRCAPQGLLISSR